MTKDELTLAKIEDKITQSRDGWYVTATGFLDSHEQALAKKAAMHAAGVRTIPKTEEGPGYGGAMLAMVCCGEYDSVDACAEALLSVTETIWARYWGSA